MQKINIFFRVIVSLMVTLPLLFVSCETVDDEMFRDRTPLKHSLTFLATNLETANAVEGVTVYLSESRVSEENIVFTDSTKTNSEGIAEISVVSGDYIYKVKGEGYADLPEESFPLRGTDKDFAISMLRIYNVAFSVVDNLNAPLANALITVGDESIYTNSEGQVEVKCPAGDNLFRVKSADNSFYPVGGTFFVSGDLNVTMKLVPKTVTTFDDIDGNTYNIVQIGELTWMEGDLKTTKYSDGSDVTFPATNGAWAANIDGAYAYPNGSVDNVALLGLLYNWHAVANVKGLAPANWHVATNDEWNELEAFVMSDGHNETEGTALKSSTGWKAGSLPNTDDYGFNVKAPGRRKTNGQFANFTAMSRIWTSTGTEDTAMARWFANNKEVISHLDGDAKA